MLETVESTCVALLADDPWSDVLDACSKIPPLWDLSNYVAVNPFLGFASQPVEEAVGVLEDGLDARVLPGIAFYRVRWSEGAFTARELREAARRRGLDLVALESMLANDGEIPVRVATPVLCFAERHDRDHGTDWNDRVIRAAARWLAVLVTRGGKSWSLPDEDRGIFARWKEAAGVDRSLEISGLRAFRAWVKRLSPDPSETILTLLDRLEISPSDRQAYLYRLLGGVYGWASFLRRSSWKGGQPKPGEVLDLLAIRIALDAAVAELLKDRPGGGSSPCERTVEDETIRLVFQEALEAGVTRRLVGDLNPSAFEAVNTRPAIQAVFCIDVRSEPMRRHLEALSPGIETIGFAGFFGVSLRWKDGETASARCPVLLEPSLCVESSHPAGTTTLGGAIRRTQTAPPASFSFVEVLGATYGLRLAADALVLNPDGDRSERTAGWHLEGAEWGSGITTDRHLDLAHSILTNMSMKDRFARLILLCGHEGQSSNNPHAAGLDCGACGGHGGAMNARFAATLLNDRDVRKGLIERGWQIPDDTRFVAGVHNTTTDAVELLDTEQVPASHWVDLHRLGEFLRLAGDQVRAERASALRLGTKRSGFLARLLERRSRDGSEVRPEWGLARNCLFIAAKRARTRGVNLEGRAFLHEYDATLDDDDAVLRLILSAPMVVASWINLQYFASTVDNRVFGAGDKTIHNRVGSLGVVLGNGGDLRTGLPLQSVHGADGKWYHEPLRLQVVVEADPGRIERVLETAPGVEELVRNGWVRLYSLGAEGDSLRLYVPEVGWEAF